MMFVYEQDTLLAFVCDISDQFEGKSQGTVISLNKIDKNGYVNREMIETEDDMMRLIFIG